jgi:hypothetical protein
VVSSVRSTDVASRNRAGLMTLSKKEMYPRLRFHLKPRAPALRSLSSGLARVLRVTNRHLKKWTHRRQMRLPGGPPERGGR